ncbi:nucleotidyltransferase family protein [Aureimonas leprariae]|uniref:nucleotidyltransferase family protein n=1 Tax=Plantimonas leprariae TaxID=2615207 RepID=UPI0031B59683
MTPRIHAVLLAAGRSSRTGASHKLLATFDDVPLIQRSAQTALASRASGVTVVLGHRLNELRAALVGLAVGIVENRRYAEGLSTSLIAGFDAAPPDAEAVLIMLADQPLLTPDDLDRMIDASAPDGRGSLAIATDGGRRFNPVVIGRNYHAEIGELTGDTGAKILFSRYPEAIAEVELGRAASFDVDSIDAIVQAGGVPESS